MKTNIEVQVFDVNHNSSVEVLLSGDKETKDTDLLLASFEALRKYEHVYIEAINIEHHPEGTMLKLFIT